MLPWLRDNPGYVLHAGLCCCALTVFVLCAFSGSHAALGDALVLWQQVGGRVPLPLWMLECFSARILRLGSWASAPVQRVRALLIPYVGFCLPQHYPAVAGLCQCPWVLLVGAPERDSRACCVFAPRLSRCSGRTDFTQNPAAAALAAGAVAGGIGSHAMCCYELVLWTMKSSYAVPCSTGRHKSVHICRVSHRLLGGGVWIDLRGICVLYLPI